MARNLNIDLGSFDANAGTEATKAAGDLFDRAFKRFTKGAEVVQEAQKAQFNEGVKTKTQDFLSQLEGVSTIEDARKIQERGIGYFDQQAGRQDGYDRAGVLARLKNLDTDVANRAAAKQEATSKFASVLDTPLRQEAKQSILDARANEDIGALDQVNNLLSNFKGDTTDLQKEILDTKENIYKSQEVTRTREEQAYVRELSTSLAPLRIQAGATTADYVSAVNQLEKGLESITNPQLREQARKNMERQLNITNEGKINSLITDADFTSPDFLMDITDLATATFPDLQASDITKAVNDIKEATGIKEEEAASARRAAQELKLEFKQLEQKYQTTPIEQQSMALAMDVAKLVPPDSFWNWFGATDAQEVNGMAQAALKARMSYKDIISLIGRYATANTGNADLTGLRVAFNDAITRGEAYTIQDAKDFLNKAK